jgi:hypothetical protein
MAVVPTRDPPLLWHYTSFQGLYGIVTEGEFIASSLAYVNDTEEFQFTIRPLLALAEARWQQRLGDEIAAGPDDTNSFQFKLLKTTLASVFDVISSKTMFVTCFSKEADDLSQWRSYTPHPPGFAIGFDEEELRLVGSSSGFSLLECRYPDKEELAEAVRVAFEAATQGLEEDRLTIRPGADSKELAEFLNTWMPQIVGPIVALALRNKHPKFRAEREVRLTGTSVGGVVPGLTVKYRVSGSLVVPYVKIPARREKLPSPIKHIMVGPCPHQEAVIAATQQICAQHEVEAEVIPSEIPFRNW